MGMLLTFGRHITNKIERDLYMWKNICFALFMISCVVSSAADGFNVKQFGALGDGMTDDAPSIKERSNPEEKHSIWIDGSLNPVTALCFITLFLP